MASILIIDDNEWLANAISFAFGDKHRSAILSNGMEAVETVKAGHFDLILMDMLMPGKSGSETMLALREANIDIPIIAMSGVVQEDQLLRMARELGAVSILRKPFKRDALIAAIESALADKGTT